MKPLYVLLLLSVLLSSSLSFDTSKYSHSAEDLLDGRYHFYWRVDEANEILYVGLAVETSGWVGFGISQNGGMVGADVMTAWIGRDGEVNIQDRFAAHKGVIPMGDDSQDWEVVSGSEEQGVTLIEAKRFFYTCDTFDRDITPGPIKIIFAFSEEKPTTPLSLQYHHSFRGSREINFYGPQPPLPNLENTISYEFTMPNVDIPPSPTTYLCGTFSLPELSVPHHIVSYEPIRSSPRVHHLVVLECSQAPNFTVGLCDSVHLEMCNLISYAYGVGSGPTVLPHDVGVPIGPGSSQWMVLQMHYDNPQRIEGLKDNSGFRIRVSPTIRLHEAGMLMYGKSPRVMAIPPGESRFAVTGDCPSDCSSQVFPSSGISLLTVGPHTHLAGVSMVTKHIRDGVELTPLVNMSYYDFEFQEFLTYSPPVQVLPGDRIITECYYNTEDRGEVTYGGEGTHDEMCYTFFMYYPKIPSVGCIDSSHGNISRVYCGKDRIVSTNPFEDYEPFAPSYECEQREWEEIDSEKSSKVGVVIAVLFFSLCIVLGGVVVAIFLVFKKKRVVYSSVSVDTD